MKFERLEALYHGHGPVHYNGELYEIVDVNATMRTAQISRVGSMFDSKRSKCGGIRLMTQKEILAQLISRVVSGEYELDEVRRSNHDELQEYDFVIKKASSKGDQ